MEYKKLAETIRLLPWSAYDPKAIVYLSWITAKEFADSLRLALQAFPNHRGMKIMAQGELQTDNLMYQEYSGPGDHWEFLEYFLKQNRTLYDHRYTKTLQTPSIEYTQKIQNIQTGRERAMTIVSREQELPGIFQSILEAHDWRKHGLGFYEYYLKRHIQLDSEEEVGHAALTKDIPLSESVLQKFYRYRIGLYGALNHL